MAYHLPYQQVVQDIKIFSLYLLLTYMHTSITTLNTYKLLDTLFLISTLEQASDRPYIKFDQASRSEPSGHKIYLVIKE